MNFIVLKIRDLVKSLYLQPTQLRPQQRLQLQRQRQPPLHLVQIQRQHQELLQPGQELLHNKSIKNSTLPP